MSRQKFAYKLIFAVGLILFAALVFLAPDIAYAQLPPSYVENVQDAGLEWWSDLLKLDEVKATVEGWFKNDEMYDFSKLDDDPIVIAVIDSGVDVEHELFSGAYGDGDAADYDVLFRTSDGDVVGKNTVGDNSDVSDVDIEGHGTHVAGIAATLIHLLGLEKYIKIMPIRAGKPIEEGGAKFDVSDIKEGAEFALENGADVVNLSIEAENDSFDLVTDEWAKEAIFVAAAGNDSSSLIKYYPAASKNVIGVMNISNERDAEGNLQLRSSSNFGSAYELCAPGTEFYSAANGEAEKYVKKSGTSMAAPVVSFASALALLKFRAIEAATHISKSVEEVREIVENSYTTQIEKGIYKLNVLDLKKLAADDNAFSRVDILSGEHKQRLGDVSPITLKLDTLFSPTGGKGSVEWALGDPNGEKIGEGFEFTFTPQNAYGAQTVYARWTFDTEEGLATVVTSFSVTVDYAEFTEDVFAKLEIGIKGDDGEFVKSVAFKKGKEYILTFAGADNYSPNETKDIKWYINGKQIGKGKEIRFMPDGSGKYEISVSVGDTSSAKSLVEFKENKTLAYVCYALVAAAVLTLAVIFIIRAYGSYRSTRRN